MAAGLSGRVAIVTGAGGGVGRTICAVLARHGAAVVAADLDVEAAESTVASLPRGAGGEAVHVDVTERESVESVVSTAAARHGRLDQMWNNAGIVQVGSLLDVASDEWARVFAVNVVGVLHGLQAAARRMEPQEPDPGTGLRGRIVNVGSAAGEVSTPAMPAYGASKAAVAHLTRTAADELADRGICVTALYPGHLMTPMWEEIDRRWGAADGLAPGEAARRRAGELARGRFQTPEELAEVVERVALARGMDLNGRVVVSDALIRRL